MEFVIDEDSQRQLARSEYARIIVGSLAYLAQSVELCISLRDIDAIKEMESVCALMFEQARKILNENESLQ